ncbi:TPA: hypothetical protein I8Y90_000383 [Legionella pneumophila]|nr:hypothetical protein [Legionella pneumophila]
MRHDVFISHSYSHGFLGFLFSITLFIWGLRHKGAGVPLAKVLGSLVAVLAVIGILCSGYYGIKF